MTVTVQNNVYRITLAVALGGASLPDPLVIGGATLDGRNGTAGLYLPSGAVIQVAGGFLNIGGVNSEIGGNLQVDGALTTNGGFVSNADSSVGAGNGANLSVGGNVTVGTENPSGHFIGRGDGLTNVPAAQLAGVVPAANGGAGSTNGILKGNGSGAVSAAGSSDLPAITLTGGVTGAASGGTIATTVASVPDSALSKNMAFALARAALAAA
jgi:hypothetical protein